MALSSYSKGMRQKILMIMGLVLVEGVRPVLEGLVIGFVIADLAEMAMRPALAKPLPAIDTALLILVPLGFLVAALVACYLPSRPSGCRSNSQL